MATEATTGEKATPLNADGAPPPVMVHVTAPANLPAGYTFEAQINEDAETTFTVEVPDGGVTEGQVFLAPLPRDIEHPHLNVPTGAWKDGLFACCNNGLFHPHLWCAICCPQILMAQVMSRMSLTWLGEPGPAVATRTTFKVCCILVFAYIVYSTAMDLMSASYTIDTMPSWLPLARSIGTVFYTLWALYALCKTRENTRARYSIEETVCVGCEDVCVSLFCSCCTVAQLARHTGEYEKYPGACCTQTGHPKGTPLVV